MGINPKILSINGYFRVANPWGGDARFIKKFVSEILAGKRFVLYIVVECKTVESCNWGLIQIFVKFHL